MQQMQPALAMKLAISRVLADKIHKIFRGMPDG
jgi:hypothetical protein